MQWMVEFEGRRLPLASVWSDELDKIVSPLKSSVEAALSNAADPKALDGLLVIIYAEDDGPQPVWGFTLSGSSEAVNYARSLIGETADLVPPRH